jgi:hypothetical protein
VEELLSYVSFFYREKLTADAIRRVVLNFYSPSDIYQSKRSLIGQFLSLLSSCASVAERRNSVARAAHEAEIDDILNIFDVLDVQNVLFGKKFVASNLDNIPKYGPEEINLAAVVERQLRTEIRVTDMAAAVEQTWHYQHYRHRGYNPVGDRSTAEVRSFQFLRLCSYGSSEHCMQQIKYYEFQRQSSSWAA